jgi:transforming growth factor-beta-induced protein
MNRRQFLKLTTASALTAAVWRFGGAANAQGAKDIVDTAIGAGSFKTLVAAVQAAGLVETLKGPGPFTVFAPTDEAFAKLPAGTVENLLKPENKQQLIDILTYHVVAGAVKAADVVKLTSATTVQGSAVKITVVDGKVMVDGANVTATDIMASNGVIHVIDAVILPPAKPAALMPETGAANSRTVDIVDTAVAAGGFQTLVAAVQAAGLVDLLKGKGPFTVFAPTDEAFAKLPAGTLESLLKPENKQQLIDILTYHVVAGRLPAATVVKHPSIATALGSRVQVTANADGVTLNGAKVIAADVMAKNGVIHAIDTVLLPPADVVETARAAGQFNTLLAALEAAGLTDAVRGGKLTVFAPTDDAFAKLPAGTVENLLKPENKQQLAKVLTYHVVRKDYDASQVSRYRTLRTAQGGLLHVRRTTNGVNINDASVAAADIFARNGVIHVVDSVLLPR